LSIILFYQDKKIIKKEKYLKKPKREMKKGKAYPAIEYNTQAIHMSISDKNSK